MQDFLVAVAMLQWRWEHSPNYLTQQFGLSQTVWLAMPGPLLNLRTTQDRRQERLSCGSLARYRDWQEMLDIPFNPAWHRRLKNRAARADRRFRLRPLGRLPVTLNALMQIVEAPAAAGQTALPVMLRPRGTAMKTTRQYPAYQG